MDAYSLCFHKTKIIIGLAFIQLLEQDPLDPARAEQQCQMAIFDCFPDQLGRALVAFFT